MNAKTWNQVVGTVLLLLVVLGVLNIGIPGFLSVNEPAEIAFHLVTGALAVYAGFTGGGYSSFAVTYAKYGGLLYLVLGVIGFFPFGMDLLGIFHFDLGCNLAHLLFGAWGVYVGFMSPGTAKAKG
ncbi:MAG: hypothetical protein ACRDFQ_00500 [Anaerolineales bacterium]